MSSKKIQPSKRGSSGKDLTPNQRLFVECLLADEKFNANQAAKKAGYKNPAHASGVLLSKPSIAAIIGKAIYQRSEKMGLKAEDVLQHLANVLYLDPIEVFESCGDGAFRVKSLDEIPPHIRRCITKLKCRTKTTEETTESFIEIELMSKDAALPLVMKHLGILGVDGSPVNVNIGQDIISAMLKQVEEERRVIDTQFLNAKLGLPAPVVEVPSTEV